MVFYSCLMGPGDEKGLAGLAVWYLTLLLMWPLSAFASGQTKPYRHGDPTDAEQLMLELVNRARANPAAEARRAGIPLNMGLRAGTISPARKQPLAFHPRLITAARRHSRWMIDTGIFDHVGKGGSQPWDRMRRAGYRLSGSYAAGENIAGQDSSLLGAEQATTVSHHEGLFRSPGHRVNIMSPSFDEVGVGILRDWVEEHPHPPIHVSRATQKFARSDFSPLPFVLGVVYCDLNGNDFYDTGEGLRDVRVDVQGARHHALTSTSGGYAVPAPSRRGKRWVRFTLGEMSFNATVRARARANSKVDWRLPFSAPVASGPTEVLAGQATRYSVTSVPAATSIDVFIQQQQQATKDSAEDLSRVEYATNDGSAPLSSAFRTDGQSAYHLRPTATGESRVLSYRDYLLPGPAAKLSFQGVLRATSDDTVAEVQISEDDGETWSTLLTTSTTFGAPGEAGESGTSLIPAPAQVEPGFLPSDIHLGHYAGQRLLLRFRLVQGSDKDEAVVRTIDEPGWFIDEVILQDTEVISTVATAPVEADQTITLQPPQPGQYQLTAVPRYHERSWPAGPTLFITAR